MEQKGRQCILTSLDLVVSDQPQQCRHQKTLRGKKSVHLNVVYIFKQNKRRVEHFSFVQLRPSDQDLSKHSLDKSEGSKDD